jgi:hypothetical protein
MPTTKDILEESNQNLAELNETVRSHADDPVTVDIDALTPIVMAILDIRDSALADEQRAADAPVRRGDPIGPETDPEAILAAVMQGDYALAKWLKARPTFEGRAQHGKFAGQKISDLQFTKNFLQAAAHLDPQGVRAGPSDGLTKLLDSTGTGTGDEFVPTGMAAELWADSFLASKVVGALGVVPMPTDPFDMPLSWGGITWRKGGVGEATASQDPTTAKSTFTATEQIAEVNWAYDLDEDGIIAVLPTLRSELTRSGSEQMDAFALNADATATSTGNINLDDDTPPTDAYYLSNGQDGIRHFYLVDVAAQSANISTTLTDALWRTGLGKLGKYGVSPAEILAITNVKTYLISMLSLTNVRTVDKYGPQAVIMTGELAKMDGVPIIVSESILLAEDDGKLCKTSGSNDEGQIALVNRNAWKVGFRRQLLIEIDRDIRKRIYIMVVSFRIAVASRDRTGTHTAGIHGITYA